MNYCKNCGVELEENMNICPLCGESIDEKSVKKEHLQSAQPQPEKKLFSDYESLTQKQRRKLFWELSGIILISGIIVTLIIDLIINKNITWSKYSITASLVIFVNITLITFWRHKIILVFVGSFVSTSILLVLLDMYNLNIGWGVKLGIPFLFSLYFIILVLVILMRISNQQGFNMLACFFIAIGLLTMCIEGIISIYTKKVFYLHWSIIVMVCMIPISAILFFIHYRLKKGIDLKRFFHI
ncbi:MAG: zinc ribbon domain-containing protein [Bacteroidales bacterium]|nr:zinc ribbon domain-containing protein [Bacteroidales bacterium]